MALTTPILNPIIPFDATQACPVTFNVIGGDQVVANTIIVTNASTGVQIYTNTVTSFAFSNTIPSNTLSNGTYYSVIVTTKNALGQTSTASNPVSFHCYTTPVVTPVNFSSGVTINNSNFTFQVQYTQAQSEPLQSYSVDFYNASGTKVSTSGVIYTSSSTVPLNISYAFDGMANNTVYFIGLTGVTLNGMSVTMSNVQFSVRYETPAVYSLVSLTNNCDGGYVTIQSNIKNINGTSNPSPPIYISNRAVDLRVFGSYVDWAAGYNITGDFTLRLWIKNPNENTTLLEQMNMNGNNVLNINYRVGYPQGSNVQQAYVDATIQSGSSSLKYYIFSNCINLPTTTNELFIFFRRVNNIYTITLQNLGG